MLIIQGSIDIATKLRIVKKTKRVRYIKAVHPIISFHTVINVIKRECVSIRSIFTQLFCFIDEQKTVRNVQKGATFNNARIHQNVWRK
jgi:hypothetical protein